MTGRPPGFGSPRREYHIVVLGAGGVGKSCLTAQFVQNIWIESYDPTIEDSYRKQMEVDGTQVILEILDTAGTEQFTAMRELYMKQGQGFLLVFSITSMSSLHELSELHDMIVRIKDDPHVPLVIVGNKSDLEDDRQVSPQRVLQLAQQWGDAPYFETSARRRINVDDIFVNVCRQIVASERRRTLVGRPLDFETLRQQQQQQQLSLQQKGDDERRYRQARPRRKRDRCVIL